MRVQRLQKWWTGNWASELEVSGNPRYTLQRTHAATPNQWTHFAPAEQQLSRPSATPLDQDQDEQLAVQHLGDGQADKLGCRCPPRAPPPCYGVEDCVEALLLRVVAAGPEQDAWLQGEQVCPCVLHALLQVCILTNTRICVFMP